MLGYESINFLEGLGSILIFATLQLILIFITIAMQICHKSCPYKFCRKTFSSEAVWQSSLAFLHGTFFEIAVCVFVSMSMMQFWGFLTSSDYASIVSAFMFLVLLIAYVGFIVDFAFRKSHKLANLNRAEVERRNIKRSSRLHSKILSGLELKKNSDLDEFSRQLLAM